MGRHHKTSGSIRRIAVIMTLVFFFIFVDVLCENFLGTTYTGELSGGWATVFFLGLGVLQVFFAPIQSAASDFYGRRTSLIISLLFSLTSLVLVYYFNGMALFFLPLIFATLFKGVVGNTLPISLALIADTKHRNYRLLFTCSTGAYAIAYLLLAKSDAVGLPNQEVNFYLILAFLVAIGFCATLIRNNKTHVSALSTIEGGSSSLNKNNSAFLSVIKNEKQLILNDLEHSPTKKRLKAFGLWELSLYVILLSQIDFRINRTTHVAESMMYGYLLGLLLLMAFYKLKDSTVIKIGYYTAFFSLVPYFIFFKVVEDQTLLLRSCYFFHAVGNAFLCPAFLSILAKRLKNHQQGRTYGITDAVDTIAYVLATGILLIFSSMKLDVIYLISISFIIFACSLKFYNQFKDDEDS